MQQASMPSGNKVDNFSWPKLRNRKRKEVRYLHKELYLATCYLVLNITNISRDISQYRTSEFKNVTPYFTNRKISKVIKKLPIYYKMFSFVQCKSCLDASLTFLKQRVFSQSSFCCLPNTYDATKTNILLTNKLLFSIRHTIPLQFDGINDKEL